MDKNNHTEEIKATRVGGFGGSDAAMLVAVAERIKAGQPLTTSQKHRVRIARGIEPPPPPFTSPVIEEGRRFEDRAATELQGWDRETYLSPMPNSMAEPRNFKVFAHADFFDFKTGGAKECKWSRKFDHKGLQKEYRWQLQWYYMLGVESVSLVSDTADGVEVSDIRRDEKAVATLREAVETLDAAWHGLDLTITEFSPDELPPEIAALHSDIASLSKDIRTMNAALDGKKAELMEWMATNATAIHGEQCTISYTAASRTLGFDSKAFEKSYPGLFAAFRTKITEKSAYLTVKLNKNNE